MANEKTDTKDWRNLPIEKWNTNTVHAFLIGETNRRYSAEYVPGGRGPKSKRWIAEKGMIKRELDKKGAETVKRFIEVCWREYYTNQPWKFPYPTFGFMVGYMDHFWSEATMETELREEMDEAIDESDAKMGDLGDDWF